MQNPNKSSYTTGINLVINFCHLASGCIRGHKETNFTIGNKMKNYVVSALKMFSRFRDSLFSDTILRFFSRLSWSNCFFRVSALLHWSVNCRCPDSCSWVTPERPFNKLTSTGSLNSTITLSFEAFARWRLLRRSSATIFPLLIMITSRAKITKPKN